MRVKEREKDRRTCLLIPLGFDGGDEGCAGALLLLAELELDIGRLFASCPVDKFPALDGDGDQDSDLL